MTAGNVEIRREGLLSGDALGLCFLTKSKLVTGTSALDLELLRGRTFEGCRTAPRTSAVVRPGCIGAPRAGAGTAMSQQEARAPIDLARRTYIIFKLTGEAGTMGRVDGKRLFRPDLENPTQEDMVAPSVVRSPTGGGRTPPRRTREDVWG